MEKFEVDSVHFKPILQLKNTTNAKSILEELTQKLIFESNEELEKLRKRFQPKIKEQKETIDTNKYQSDQNKIKLEEIMCKKM